MKPVGGSNERGRRMGFFDAMGDIFKSMAEGNRGLSASQRALELKRERELGSLAIKEAELQRFLAAKQREWDLAIDKARREGINHPRAVMSSTGWFDGQRAIVRFQMGAEPGRMDVFYGGTDNNPLDNDDHGHIVAKNGLIISWELPGPKGRRKRVI